MFNFSGVADSCLIDLSSGHQDLFEYPCCTMVGSDSCNYSSVALHSDLRAEAMDCTGMVWSMMKTLEMLVDG